MEPGSPRCRNRVNSIARHFAPSHCLGRWRERTAAVLVLDERECGASTDRVLTHSSLSSISKALVSTIGTLVLVAIREFRARAIGRSASSYARPDARSTRFAGHLPAIAAADSAGHDDADRSLAGVQGEPGAAVRRLLVLHVLRAGAGRSARSRARSATRRRGRGRPRWRRSAGCRGGSPCRYRRSPCRGCRRPGNGAR
jgi:hypothetical protein